MSTDIQTIGITSFPEEVLFQIFSYLPIETYPRVILVCHLFKRLMGDEYLIKDYYPKRVQISNYRRQFFSDQSHTFRLFSKYFPNTPKPNGFNEAAHQVVSHCIKLHQTSRNRHEQNAISHLFAEVVMQNNLLLVPILDRLVPVGTVLHYWTEIILFNNALIQKSRFLFDFVEKYGAKPDIHGESFNFALKTEDPQLLQRVIELQAPTNAASFNTALSHAPQLTLEPAFRAGARPNEFTFNHAIYQGPDILRTCIEMSSISPNAESLYHAVKSANTATVQVVLGTNPPIDLEHFKTVIPETTRDILTPIVQFAVNHQNDELLKCLIIETKNNAALNVATIIEENFLIQISFNIFNRLELFDAAQALVQRGYRPNQEDLRRSIETNNYSMTQGLLQAGVSITFQNILLSISIFNLSITTLILLELTKRSARWILRPLIT